MITDRHFNGARNMQMDDGLNELLSTLGVSSSDDGTKVRQTVERELRARNTRGEVIELRYGKLVIGASRHDAGIVRFNKDQIQKALEKVVPGVVQSITVRVSTDASTSNGEAPSIS